MEIRVNKLPENADWGLLVAIALGKMSRERMVSKYGISINSIYEYMNGRYTCPVFNTGCKMLAMMVDEFPEKIGAVTGSDLIPVLPNEVDWLVLPEMIKALYPVNSMQSMMSEKEFSYYVTLRRGRAAGLYRPTYCRGAEIINWARPRIDPETWDRFWRKRPKFKYLKVAA